MGESRQERIRRKPEAFGRLRRYVLYGSLSANAKLVFAAIDDHQGKSSEGADRSAYPSYAQIARLLSYGERTVSRAVAELVAVGALRVERRPGRTNLMMALPTPDSGDRSPGLNGDTGGGGNPSGETGGPDSGGRQRRIRKKNQEEKHARPHVDVRDRRPLRLVPDPQDTDEESGGATLAELRTHPDETIQQIVERLSKTFGDIDGDEG